MIDFHSHVLPFVDDGSRSIEESLQMLKWSKSMGVDTIVSTSHYYANRESVESFIKRRDESLKSLVQAVSNNDDIPQIITGAELAFFAGMSREKEISRLCIGDTKYLLLEMPFYEWTSLTIKEVRGVMINMGITPIIAHIERYIALQKKNNQINELLELGVVVQANAEAIIKKDQRRLILKMIDNDLIHVLGSDCHNTVNRPPNMESAVGIIQKKLGTKALENIENNGRKIIAC